MIFQLQMSKNFCKIWHQYVNDEINAQLLLNIKIIFNFDDEWN